MARTPNKFNNKDQLGPFGIHSGPDKEGLYKHNGCMWLIGFVTYKSPHRFQTLKDAVDFREMNDGEIRQHLSDIETVYENRSDMREFVQSVIRRL